MAQLMRKPVLSTLGLQPSTLLPSRLFHAASLQCAAPRSPQAQQPRIGPGRSVRLSAQDGNKLPTDLGLLPETFVCPSRPNRPSLFTEPKDAVRLQWIRFRKSVLHLFQLVIYKYQAKPRPKLAFRQIAPTAVGLHNLMYTAFAEGDIKTLRKICADGLLENFEGRIRARPKERWIWELSKYNKSPRVMSNRGATLGIEGMSLRQAVVRICSRQKLTRYRDGKIVPGSGQEKDVVEYVVIQKTMLQGKEGEWQVWGTTEETTLDILEEQESLRDGV